MYFLLLFLFFFFLLFIQNVFLRIQLSILLYVCVCGAFDFPLKLKLLFLFIYLLFSQWIFHLIVIYGRMYMIRIFLFYGISGKREKTAGWNGNLKEIELNRTECDISRKIVTRKFFFNDYRFLFLFLTDSYFEQPSSVAFGEKKTMQIFSFMELSWFV